MTGAWLTDAATAVHCRLLNAAERTGIAPRLDPVGIMKAYARGLFPMGRPGSDRRIAWFYPDPRGVLPLQAFHVPHRLGETMASGRYRVTVDHDFVGTIDACAVVAPDRPERWINETIRMVWIALHRQGHAHSVEVWQDDARAGGLYGVALGGAFFAESMFSHRRDGSKVALAHLVVLLRGAGFTMLDTQFPSRHLQQFGGTAISRADYRARLADAIAAPARFCGEPDAGLHRLLRSAS